VRRNKIKLYPDNTWLWLAGANLLLCLAFLLFFILVTWLSIGAAQAWEFQSPISFEDDEPVIKKPVPAAPPEIRSTYTQRETAPPPPEVKPIRYPL
jgi:hypothetical protein